MNWRVALSASGASFLVHVRGENDRAAKSAAVEKVARSFASVAELPRPEIRVKRVERIGA
ncbi:MAG: hypothetical protein JNG85_14675 [Spirochaetaceae bacterium]|nr:hypothetical protein [Spirochaetaceae bacterium]